MVCVRLVEQSLTRLNERKNAPTPESVAKSVVPVVCLPPTSTLFSLVVEIPTHWYRQDYPDFCKKLSPHALGPRC